MGYKERETHCDFCESLVDCLRAGRILDATCRFDENRHYMLGIGEHCEKWVSKHDRPDL